LRDRSSTIRRASPGPTPGSRPSSWGPARSGSTTPPRPAGGRGARDCRAARESGLAATAPRMVMAPGGVPRGNEGRAGRMSGNRKGEEQQDGRRSGDMWRTMGGRGHTGGTGSLRGGAERRSGDGPRATSRPPS
jgi:hypothetical protein